MLKWSLRDRFAERAEGALALTGTHYEALPVNAPKAQIHHYHKDGAMRFFKNGTGNPDAYC